MKILSNGGGGCGCGCDGGDFLRKVVSSRI